jgi:hypothetical protein
MGVTGNGQRDAASHPELGLDRPTPEDGGGGFAGEPVAQNNMNTQIPSSILFGYRAHCAFALNSGCFVLGIRWNRSGPRDRIQRQTMRRRASRQPTNGHAFPHAHGANHCRALVLVDGTRIRKKIKKDYEKVLGDLDKARRQLDQFNQTDQPQFTRWLNSQFGALLTELRELSRKIAVDEGLIFQVEREVMIRGGSHARAYKRVMEFRENPGPPPSAAGGEPGGEQAWFGGGPETRSGEDADDPLHALFDEVFGDFGPDEGRYFDEHGPEAGHHPGLAAPAHASSRLKELYRALVRRLHPDCLQEMSAQKTEWWHQAQAAYEAGDAEQLEVILSLCEIGESGTTAHTSASLLQRITAQLKSSLREIKRQIGECRRDLAWNFSRRSDRDVMAAQMRRAMTEDLDRMRGQWQEIQETIAEWKAAAERLKEPRRRKPQPQGMEYPF